VAAKADFDFIFSRILETKQLWITFRRGWAGRQDLEISSP